MSFELEDLKKDNSGLLDLLTQHLPDMLWVKDLNGIYIYANQAICDRLLMAKDTQEPIGKGDIFFALREREAHKDIPDWHTFGELCFNSDVEVIAQNKPMKFEEYGNVKGKLMYLEVYKAPFYDENGKIIGTVGTGRDITELKKIQTDLEKNLKMLDEKKKKLSYQANHDILTDLPNRTLFMDRLNQAIFLADEDNNNTTLLFIDLDNFKDINDSFGHYFGDKILLEFISRIKKKIKETDTLARFGGDEFCVILNNIENIDTITDFVLEIMDLTKEDFIINDRKLHVSTSIGISFYPNDGKTANILLKNADAAMHTAKENGKNTYSFYNKEMTKNALERISLETDLRRALKEDELVVYFQPQVDANNDTIIGMEALVRWQHPTLGLIVPDKFIPLAETTGLIVQLDRIIMKKAMTQLAKWYKEGLNPGVLAMNLAVKQLHEKDFIEMLKGLLEETGCKVEWIELEVTESQIMTNPVEAIKLLTQITNLNIKLAVDDFGTGYSSLAYLKKLPIDKLKIDQTFVKDLPDDEEDIGITKAIIALAKSLNLRLIAEGVETIEQKDFLVENGCKNIQGYLYSKPISIDEMSILLVDRFKKSIKETDEK